MKHFLLTFSLFLVLAFSSGQKQNRLLFDAYKSNSPKKLELFFKNWANKTLPIAPTDISKLNDTIRNVYLIFQQFYDPLKIENIGGSEWGNDIYSKVKYFLLQDKINFGFVDTLDKEILMLKEFKWLAKKLNISVDSVIKGYKTNRTIMKSFRFEWPTPEGYGTLNHFRPCVNFQSPKTIVLTSAYDSLLNGFLGGSQYPLGAENIMSPAKAKDESASRQKFLENCIRIWYGHWGGYWQLYSYPFVNAITFDKSFQYALVDYRLIYEGGYAYFKKVNNIWTLIEAKRTWIE